MTKAQFIENHIERVFRLHLESPMTWEQFESYAAYVRQTLMPALSVRVPAHVIAEIRRTI